MIAKGTSFRAISRQFWGNDTARDAVRRHAENCLKFDVAAAAAAKQANHREKFYERLEKRFGSVEKMLDACEKWLADPDNENEFDISPRDTELTVVYVDPNELDLLGNPRTKKATLDKIFETLAARRLLVSDLNSFIADQGETIETEDLNDFVELHASLPTQVIKVKSDAVDNRKLMLDSLSQFTKQMQIAARVYGIEQQPRENDQKIEKVVKAVIFWLEDHPSEKDNLTEVVRDFARASTVPSGDLMDKVIEHLGSVN